MKLATLKDDSRDGRLVVVSKDLSRYCTASNIAPTLQAALDNWAELALLLETLARDVENEAVPCERFREREAHSPLPRAYQWADGSAYINHVELVRKARGAEVPESFYHDPLMYQGARMHSSPHAKTLRSVIRPGAAIWKARSPASQTMSRWA